MVQINLRVDDETKERWENHLEETREFPTVSELIRKSVQYKIKTYEEEPEDTTPAPDADIQELKDEISDIRKDVAWLREQEQEGENISTLAQTVYDSLEALPNPKRIDAPDDLDGDESEYRKQVAAQSVIQPNNTEDREQEGSSPQTISDISDRVGAPEKRVLDAIEHLQDQFLPVKEVELGDNIHYFKEE